MGDLINWMLLAGAGAVAHQQIQQSQEDYDRRHREWDAEDEEYRQRQLRDQLEEEETEESKRAIKRSRITRTEDAKKELAALEMTKGIQAARDFRELDGLIATLLSDLAYDADIEKRAGIEKRIENAIAKAHAYSAPLMLEAFYNLDSADPEKLNVGEDGMKYRAALLEKQFAAGGLPVPHDEIQTALVHMQSLWADRRLAQFEDAAWIDQKMRRNYGSLSFLVRTAHEIDKQFEAADAPEEKRLRVRQVLANYLEKSAENRIKGVAVRQTGNLPRHLADLNELKNNIRQNFEEARLPLPASLTAQFEEKRIAVVRDHVEAETGLVESFTANDQKDLQPKNREERQRLLLLLETEKIGDDTLERRIENAFAAANMRIANANLEIAESRTTGNRFQTSVRLMRNSQEQKILADYLTQSQVAVREAIGEGPMEKEYAQRVEHIEDFLHPIRAVQKQLSAKLGL